MGEQFMEGYDSAIQLKEKLLAAGAEEIMSYGINGLSLRRVAAACGASCAAPYKHFKNKDDFVAAVISYVEDRWNLMAVQIAGAFEDPCQRIAELCVANVRFKAANPLYGAGKSDADRIIIAELMDYCQKRNLDDAEGRIFAIRALAAGTISLIESGSLENSQETLQLLRRRVLAELM